MDINTLPTLDAFAHRMPLQIRFSDVDVLGHVNNTVYLAFFDTGKAGFFTSVRGVEADWKHVDTVIANVDCAFVNPIYFRDSIEVLTRCKEIGEKSFRLQQVIVNAATGEIKAAAETVMVAIDNVAMKAQPIPESFRKALKNSMTHEE